MDSLLVDPLDGMKYRTNVIPMNIVCIGISLPCAWRLPGHRILAPRLRYAYETAAKRNYVYKPGGLSSLSHELALLPTLPSLSRLSLLRYY